MTTLFETIRLVPPITTMLMVYSPSSVTARSSSFRYAARGDA
jgi:hypothetical protein